MPRKVLPATVNFKDERERASTVKKAGKEGLTLGNFFRVRAGLEPLKHGGKRAAKKRAGK